MLFRQDQWQGLVDGTITVAFRKWKRPTVRAGGRLRSPGGLLSIDVVTRLATLDDIDEDDLRRAGLESVDEIRRAFGDREGDWFRVEFHRLGEDDRIALRNDDVLGDEDRAAIDARLARLDKASPTGPWTRQVLELIADRPAVRAGDLADAIGMARLPFKANVRKLKALGLTESLDVGYRLSPRGRAYVSRS